MTDPADLKIDGAKVHSRTVQRLGAQIGQLTAENDELREMLTTALAQLNDAQTTAAGPQ